MNDLKYPQKFGLIAILLVVLLIGILTPLFSKINGDIRFVEEELEGLHLVNETRVLIEYIQQHRGLTSIYINDSSVASRLIDKQNDIVLQFDNIEMNYEPYFTYSDTEYWDRVKTKFNDTIPLIHNGSSDPYVLYELHTEIIADLLTIVKIIAQKSNLMTDSELETNYLANELVNRLLIGTEQIGQMRALASGMIARGNVTTEEKSQLLVRLEVIRSLHETIGQDNQGINYRFPHLYRPLNEMFIENEIIAQSFLAFMKEEVIDTGELNVNAVQLFDEATKLITSYYGLYDLSATVLQDLLEQRLAYLKNEIYLIAFFVLGFILTMFYIFIGFYISVKGTVNKLEMASKRLADGDFKTKVELGTKDELAKVGAAYNDMAQQINELFTANEKSKQYLVESEQRFKSLFDNNVDYVVSFDVNGRLLSANSSFEKGTGYSSLDLLGEEILIIVHKNDHEKVIENFEESLKGTSNNYDMTMLHKDGSELHLNVVNIPIVVNEEVFGVYVIGKDMTEIIRNQNERRLRLERVRKQQETLLDLTSMKSLVEGNLKSAIPRITEAAANTLDVTRVSIWLNSYDRSTFELMDVFDKTNESHKQGSIVKKSKLEVLYSMFSHGINVTIHDVHETRPCHGKDKLHIYFERYNICSVIFVPVRKGGEIVGIVVFEQVNKRHSWQIDEENFANAIANLVVMALEREEQKRNEERINFLAFHDSLTELPNRASFNQQLEKTIAEAKERNEYAAVLFLDLDMFKNINDTLGHTAGDKLLQLVAGRIKGCLDDGQTVARLGGDEFVIILPNINFSEEAEAAAKRINNSLSIPFQLDEREVFISTSIGISVYPEHGDYAETLVRNADIAMYHAKERGRNNYQVYTFELFSKALNRMELESHLRKAIERDEMELYFQPQVRLDTGELKGLEALIRWKHKQLGMISPAEFIPLAEETGLIIPIGEWVIREACRKNKEWQDAGYDPLRMCVNISVRQFMQPDLVDVIDRVLCDTKLSPKWLGIEITESVSAYHIDTVISTLQSMRELGVQISIDDFGTGHSSLSYLKQFPIDTLKIDQSFIRGMKDNDENLAIVKSVLEMSKGLHLTVIAEGVETEEQLEILRRHNCEFGQGYLFSKPLCSSDLEMLLMGAKNNFLSIYNH